MKKSVSVLTIAALLTGATALAQTPPPRATTPPPVEPAAQQTPAPRPAGRLENIKLELTITDQTGPGVPMRKVVTMIVADREVGAIRSRGRVQTGPNRWQDLTLNVDAAPTIVRDGGAVRVQLGLEYQPQPGTTASTAREVEAASAQLLPVEPASANLNQRITMLLEPGKPLSISQAADPTSDRRITVELTATILK